MDLGQGWSFRLTADTPTSSVQGLARAWQVPHAPRGNEAGKHLPGQPWRAVGQGGSRQEAQVGLSVYAAPTLSLHPIPLGPLSVPHKWHTGAARRLRLEQCRENEHGP